MDKTFSGNEICHHYENLCKCSLLIMVRELVFKFLSFLWRSVQIRKYCSRPIRGFFSCSSYNLCFKQYYLILVCFTTPTPLNQVDLRETHKYALLGLVFSYFSAKQYTVFCHFQRAIRLGFSYLNSLIYKTKKPSLSH